MSPILKLAKDDDEKELDFEIEFQRTLTTQRRFEMMFSKSKELALLLLKNGHRRPLILLDDE